ncbi:hypothetical protein SprV_0602052400 [Sparganum proliferum]
MATSQSATPADSEGLSGQMAHLQLSSSSPNPPTNGDADHSVSPVASASSRPQPSAAAVPRTGIPRYAIPYRRPDRLPCGPTSSGEYSNGHATAAAATASSSATAPQSEASLTSPPSISPGYGGGGGGGSVGAYDNMSDAGSVGGQGSYGLAGQRNGRLLSQRTDQRESTRARSARARGRYDRAMSEDFLGGGGGVSVGGCGDTESEHSSAFSSSGQPRRITAKVNSLANASYKPGGGNVKILDRKVDFSNAKSKCNSKANIHYKPGGGDICIMDEKLTFKEASKPKVNSLQNAKHAPRGGDVKIFNEKLPWLRYNKPNLPRAELEKINKHAS